MLNKVFYKVSLSFLLFAHIASMWSEPGEQSISCLTQILDSKMYTPYSF